MRALKWVIAACVAAVPALAQETIYVPLLTYRTGPFAGSGQPIANGMHDYLEMLNQRDGGIGGVKLVIEECETGYDTKKGLECYEAVKGKNPVMINPWSTGITLPLIPRAAVDKIPVLSMGYGLSAAARGDLFPWVFNPPATYWDGMAMIMSYMAQQEGGAPGDLSKLKGKKIGYLYLDAGFGKEPLPLLEQLSKAEGFDVKLYPVAAADMQNQGSQWLGVRRDRPDAVILYGWGALNAAAIKEGVKVGYDMNKVFSIWWPSEDDARNAGPQAVGIRELNWHAVGNQFPAMQDIIKHVYDKNLAQGDKAKVGELIYNRGIYNSVLIAEAIRTAQQLSGKKAVNGEDTRRGLEQLNITDARWTEIGLPGFAGPLQLTCTNHNGHQPAFMQKWDGDKWARVSDPIAPLTARLEPLMTEAANDYVAKAVGWPKRSEICDRG